MKFAITIASLTLLCVQLHAQAAGEVRLDPAQIRTEIRSFETILNKAITTAFSSSPFAVIQKVKGTQLIGVVLCDYLLYLREFGFRDDLRELPQAVVALGERLTQPR